MSFALLPTTLTMLCAGMAGFPVPKVEMGKILNKVFQEKDKQ